LGTLRYFANDLESIKEQFGITRIGEEEGSLLHPRDCCGPTNGNGGPSPVGPRCCGAATGRGHSSPTTASPCRGPVGGRSPVGPRYHGLDRRRGGPSAAAPSPIMVQPEGRGCLVTVDYKGPDDEGPVPPLVSSSPFFFSQKCRRFFSPFFS
jgi:hypothetical protein